jgi:hypothetical protein
VANSNYSKLTAESVITNLTDGTGGEGQMTAIRNISDLLHGHMNKEEFDKITEIVKDALSLENLSPRRKVFNESYLNAIHVLSNLSFEDSEV